MFRFALVSGVAGNWLLVLGAVAQAHGGVPILQVGPERVNPGGTIELVGDMTQEGSLEILLVVPAQASVRSLGAVETDFEGHFRTFVAIPSDVATGSYQIRARMASEEAVAPLDVVGAPLDGEAGQLLGQDEARAPVPPDPGSESGVVAAPSQAQPSDGDGVIGLAALVTLAAVGVALLVGRVAGSRHRTTSN